MSTDGWQFDNQGQIWQVNDNENIDHIRKNKKKKIEKVYVYPKSLTAESIEQSDSIDTETPV